jgi:hypothetical protein
MQTITTIRPTTTKKISTRASASTATTIKKIKCY